VDVKVDDLLANIRKSIDSDFDSLSGGTTSQARGTLMRGALREMRISMGVDSADKPAVVEELSDLRTRIKQKVETAALERFAPVQPAKAVMPLLQVRGDFSGIMTRPTPVQSSVGLRPSLGHEDNLRYAPLPPPTQWQAQEQELDDPYAFEEPDAYAPPDPYAQNNHGYEEQAYQAALEAPLMSRHSEAQTETAFRHLSDALLARATGDRSLEDMTRDMLRTMLKQWLDANLPSIVEDMVREEIQRVARRGR
jgi:Protein of unknown function (DUF2497)